MKIKKWIQKKVCEGLWTVMTHIEKDVVMEFTIDLEKQTNAEIHKCECKEGHEHEVVCHDNVCTCMTEKTLRSVEQEWIERGLIQ